MIPKIVHYCWVSSEPFPRKIQHCIDSWGKFLPGYEMRQWTMEKIWRELEDDGREGGGEALTELYSRWLQEAFDARKYAFVADWVRLYALNKYGGIYLDSDVEVFKSFDDLLDLPYFLGFENGNCPETAVMGAQKECFWIGKCLAYYRRRRFVLLDDVEVQKHIAKGEYISDLRYSVRPSPWIAAEILARDYEIVAIKNKEAFAIDKKVVCLFPKHFFSYSDAAGGREKNERYCIHHGVGSWKSRRVQRNLQIWAAAEAILGYRTAESIVKGVKRMIGKGG